MQDAKHWDEVHKRIHKETKSESKYAQDKEKLFPRNAVVVDLGGGTGNDALYFLQKGHRVILLDISEFALTTAQEKAKASNLGAKLVARQVDFGLTNLPLKDDSVDVFYSRISLHYFPADQTVRIFQDIYRALRSGGSAFLTF